jgi:hypothetical protein
VTSPLAVKIGIREEMRIIFIDAPAEALEAIDPPRESMERRLAGEFNYIHFFVRTAEAFQATFPKLKSHLKQNGMLWVSWPKAGKLGTDLTIKNVIGLGYAHGLVESKCISIDPTWSALKFTFPKPGKEYNNSYGKLK